MADCVQRACLVVSRSWRPSPVGSGASSRRERAAWSKGEVGPDECRGSAGDWRRERVSRMAQLVWRASSTRGGRERARHGVARAGGGIEQGEVTEGDVIGPEPGEGFIGHLIEEADGGFGSRRFLRRLFGL